MTKRYEAKTSNVPPDAATYTTAINAWARSKEPDAVDRAEEILAWCEESYALGNSQAKPNSLTYNSLINCYSKSFSANSAEKAMGVLDLMKEKSRMEGFEDCRPDVVTYTSVIDALAKQKSVEAGEKAIALLDELERAYEESQGDELLRPNVRTYTSVSLLQGVEYICCLYVVLMCSDMKTLLRIPFTDHQCHRTQWKESRQSRGHSREN